MSALSIFGNRNEMYTNFQKFRRVTSGDLELHLQWVEEQVAVIQIGEWDQGDYVADKYWGVGKFVRAVVSTKMKL